MRGVRSLNDLPFLIWCHHNASARWIEALTKPLAARRAPTAAPSPPESVQVSKLLNGLVITSLENYSPFSNVGVFVKAGSRYDTLENQGVSHVLRLAAKLTTKGASAFKICRGVEALGGSLSVTSSTETLAYTANCLRDDLVTTAQDVRPWEVEELTSRVKVDKAVAQQCPLIGVIEKLHEAAYKTALSNSLYCPDNMVGRISPKQLQSFVQDNCTTGRMALVGLGVLRQVGEGFLSVRSGAGAPVVKSVYRGGELRVQNHEDLVHAVIASDGGVTGSVEADAFSVLQRILGTGMHSETVTNVEWLSFRPQLFGVYTIAQAASAAEVIKASVAQVRAAAEGNVSEADISRAKSQVKAEYLMSVEGSDGLMEEIGAQALNTAAYQLPDTVLQAIDTITTEDVVKVTCKKNVDAKKTMAASGHLVNTPFMDEV
ncbi:hypothetical protein Q5P01_017374 [Channa striata]|uniref:Uncharacterized protein n=1 Tax=Channa striata TaxID=64152 RepID=A0AA88M9W4_CHASR|nr:hypothetical protein Q5P01_017374 [Channa striata]